MANTEDKKLAIDVIARIDKLEKAMARAKKVSGDTFKSIETRNATFTKRLNAQMAAASGSFGTLFRSALAPLIAAVGAGALGKAFIQKTIAQQDAVQQLTAVLKSTGGAAGVTSDAAQQLAASLQKVTTFGDEAIIPAESLLLTFTKIGKDIFPAATETVLDMSQALGQDLKSSAIQVGKALQDPILGVTALQRVGVNFSASQKNVIKTLVDTGKTAEAQKLILKELQTEFGGSARAARDTLGGALKALNNAWGDLFELNGPQVEGLRRQIEGITSDLSDPATQQAVAVLGEAIFTAFRTVVDELKQVGLAIGEVEGAFDHLSSSTGLTTFLGWVNKASTAVDRLVQAAADLGQITGLSKVGESLGAKPYIGPARIQDRIDGAFAGTGVPAGGNATDVTVTHGNITPGGGNTGGTAGSSAKAIKEQRDRAAELITTLQQELSLVGASEKTQAEANALRHAGADATADQKKEIVALVDKIYDQNEAYKRQQEQIKEVQEAARDFAGTFVDDMLEGKKATEALGDALKQLASRLVNGGLDQLFGGAGGGGGALFGELFTLNIGGAQ